MVEVASYEEYLALPEDRKEAARIFLVSHHEDPIVKFDPQLAVDVPRWLQEPREPGVPRGIRWRPVGTFLNVGVDLKNSTDVVPGVFVSRGHDYRADLARFTSLAYDLPASDEQTAPHRAGAAGTGTGVGHRPGPGRAVAAGLRGAAAAVEPVGDQ